MRWLPAILLVVTAGCYRRVTERACHVTCGMNESTGQMDLCPDNLRCRGDGLCAELDGTCSVDPGIDASQVDDGPRTIGDGGMLCYGHSFQFCFTATPSNTKILGTVAIDTSSTNSSCVVMSSMPFGEKACVLAAGSVVISGTSRAIGTYPLVIIADQTIQITGTLDVSDDLGVIHPAGAPFISCIPGVSPGTDLTKLAGGGAGGSFGRGGGAGGASSNEAGGVAGAPVIPPVFPRGGCDGQVGASISGTARVISGHGGGAVYLIAGTSISAMAGSTMNASGSGSPTDGVPGDQQGGGGGGSGGLIGFDAPSLLLAGAIVANGGGGAGGSDGVQSGTAGASPDPSMPGVAASGGTGVMGVGAGNGGFGTTLATPASAVGNAPSGGGGGGVGYILTRGLVTPATNDLISPPIEAAP